MFNTRGGRGREGIPPYPEYSRAYILDMEKIIPEKAIEMIRAVQIAVIKEMKAKTTTPRSIRRLQRTTGAVFEELTGKKPSTAELEILSNLFYF